MSGSPVFDLIEALDHPGKPVIHALRLLILESAPEVGEEVKWNSPSFFTVDHFATMNLRAITIGMVPESRPGSVGLVGMPNWMWVDQPAANTWGPITRSASAAGWTVTATARVSKVTWDMGDSAPVVCNGPGTPYEDSYGKSASPTCGHTYTRQGTYTVRDLALGDHVVGDRGERHHHDGSDADRSGDHR